MPTIYPAPSRLCVIDMFSIRQVLYPRCFPVSMESAYDWI
jgi:hypothetical protein